MVQEWAKAYKAAPVTYEAVGSGKGIRRIKAKEIGFGLSDMALSVPELEAARLVQFPVLLGGIVPIVNLKGLATGQLRLSGPALAGIYLGKIKTWNDGSSAASAEIKRSCDDWCKPEESCPVWNSPNNPGFPQIPPPIVPPE